MTKPKLKPMTLDEIEKRVGGRAERYENESTLKQLSAKHDKALAASVAFEAAYRVAIEILLGTAKAEVARTLTALLGAYRREMVDLGLTAERIDAKDEEL